MKNIFKLSILLIFCMFVSINSYGESKMENNIDFKKIAKDIRKIEPKPPLLSSGDWKQQGTDVSKYFTNVINENDDIYKLKEILEKNDYFVDWRDENGKKIKTENQKAKELNALFVFNKIFQQRDAGIILGVTFNDAKNITNIKAIYFTYPY